MIGFEHLSSASEPFWSILSAMGYSDETQMSAKTWKYMENRTQTYCLGDLYPNPTVEMNNFNKYINWQNMTEKKEGKATLAFE